MPYRTISLVVTDTTDADVLAAAVSLAERESAHLDIACLGIEMVRIDSLPALGAGSVLLDADIAAAREQARGIEAWVREQLPPGQDRITISSATVPNMAIDSVVGRLVRYADLVIAGRPYGENRNDIRVVVVETELFGGAAPLLVVPPGARDTARPFRRPVIAWNEGPEALRAVREALPLLVAAEHVDIVLVDPPRHSMERSDPGGGLSLMLSRHGVKAEVSILSQTLPKVSEVIQRFARENGGDLIVMGAYGHSRFRESLLGGATREMLESAQVPVLMAR